MNEIKSILSKNHTHKIEWNGKYKDISIHWDKIELNELNNTLMGDLFSYPIYDFDSIILHHTQETISNINLNGKYIIKFYISRIICDKRINKNSVGIVY